MQNPSARETMTMNLGVKTRSQSERSVALRRSVVDRDELLHHRDEERREVRSEDANHRRQSGQNAAPREVELELQRAQKDGHHLLHRLLADLRSIAPRSHTPPIFGRTVFREAKKSMRYSEIALCTAESAEAK